MWLKCDLRTANSCTSGDYWDFDDSCCSCIDYWHFHILRQLNELCHHNKRISSKVLLLQGQAKMKCREYQFWGNHSCQKYQFWVTGPSLNRMPSLLSHPQGCHFPDGKKIAAFSRQIFKYMKQNFFTQTVPSNCNYPEISNLPHNTNASALRFCFPLNYPRSSLNSLIYRGFQIFQIKVAIRYSPVSQLVT